MSELKMEAFITGIGWVSKKSMGYPNYIQQFECDATLPGIKGKDILENPYKPFGRMDVFSKLGFTAITFAMKDAGIKRNGNKKDISIIASTATGCLETDMRFRETLSKKIPSPAIFAYTLDSSFLGEASIYFGLTGESFVINEEKTNGLAGLLMGLEIIDSGVSDIVLCGICNSDMKILDSDSHIIKPGALFFVIEKKSLHSYGTLTSTSLTNIYYQHNIKITGLYDLAEKCYDWKI